MAWTEDSGQLFSQADPPEPADLACLHMSDTCCQILQKIKLQLKFIQIVEQDMI